MTNKQNFKNTFQIKWSLCAVKDSGSQRHVEEVKLFMVVPLELPDDNNKVLYQFHLWWTQGHTPGIAF